MDSISGHSEGNQEKKDKFEIEIDENVKFVQDGEAKMIELCELPWEEQEKIREFMEMTGDEESPEIFSFEMKMEVTDLKYLPMEILINGFMNAIVDEEFELAEEHSVEIKRRGYDIDISDDLLTLTHKNEKSE